MKILQILPNPNYVYPHDPAFAPGFVGARVDPERTVQMPSADSGVATTGSVGIRVVAGRQRTRQRTVFKYTRVPETVPDTKHYRNGVRDGALVAVDKETARKCGVQFDQQLVWKLAGVSAETEPAPTSAA